MDSQGLQGHLSRARDGHKQLHRNNVLFDTLLPSGRKGDDSQRKHTNLFFMLGLFTQCSHPYFYPSLSVSHCLRSFLSPPPVHLYFPKDDLMIWSVCVCVCMCVENLTLGVLHRQLASDKHTRTHTSAAWESCCVIVSSVHGGNTKTRLSDSHFMTSLKQIPPAFLSSYTNTPYCSHAFLAPDAHYKILLVALWDFTGRAIPASSFPPADFLPVDITSSLSKYHHTLEGNRSINKLWIKGGCKISHVCG